MYGIYIKLRTFSSYVVIFEPPFILCKYHICLFIYLFLCFSSYGVTLGSMISFSVVYRTFFLFKDHGIKEKRSCSLVFCPSNSSTLPLWVSVFPCKEFSYIKSNLKQWKTQLYLIVPLFNFWLRKTSRLI